MKSRDRYLNKLVSWKDKQVIKVITGARRCGKSSLLMMTIQIFEITKSVT